ncbi:hypothetical protein SAMN05216207_101196 [Pseudonocardia ammonioxydans]|uniref:PurE domain-containing protein n=1 Tax=Pseudonocardia ammonioxydans TaxID=260086 RepID=A0A1I4XJV9_PSUAM|nr:nickel pincer cofactor biosynthesis protein LarB [Pseudonocardia ammonioxydans]SFN26085.1 hypothetical protein SAMN05216207_101196 [Pseudonocardia ammonioxydans]
MEPGSYAHLDHDRLGRTGDPEVVFGLGKTPAQVAELLGRLHAAHPERAVFATRLDDAALDAVAGAHPAAELHRTARAAVLGPLPAPHGSVLVVTGGTADGPVAGEAALTVRVHGAHARVIADVGVAGVHRVLGIRDELAGADCVIVVAGMEGALASVVGGLTGVPTVAVPTSIGYGAAFEGLAALLGMLTSCAPGTVVVNIDNGYGAGVHAARVARRTGRDDPRT